MKGIVFTEFLEMVEARFSFEVADEILSSTTLASGGSYTAVGTYPSAEMVQLVVRLSEVTNTPLPDLLLAFGRHLFGRFVVLYPGFFEKPQSAFDFLSNVETYIHCEVRKLFPDAELPQFDTVATPGQLEMTYRSERAFSKLAEGLILGCIDHFRERIRLERDDCSDDTGRVVKFTLTQLAEESQ